MKVPKIHKLKVWLKYYTEIDNETKTFELRKNDRDFKVNYYLFLQPYDNEKQIEVQMGRQLAKITYILEDAENFGLMKGFVILGLKFLKSFTEE